MTAPEHLDARLAAIQPSRRCAPAHNAKVRFKQPKTLNKPTHNRKIGTWYTPTAAPRPLGPQTGCLAPIQIP